MAVPHGKRRGKEVYRRRKLTEHAYAKMKNRVFGRMLVHGIAGVRSVCLLHAITHNLLHAHGLRSAAAGRNRWRIITRIHHRRAGE